MTCFRRPICALSFFFFVSLLVPGVALAIPAPRPSTTEPSQTGQHLRIEEERPAVGGEPVITLPEENGGHKTLKGSATFVLKGVEFEHLTVFKAEDLRPDYAEYIGKPVNFSTLSQITSRITAHYRNAGYILSRAVLSPQKIEHGIVKIRIVEGVVNKVRFEGLTHKSTLLEEYAEHIHNAKPLDAATLERYLLLMEDLPGVEARAVLRPSPDMPGASDVVVNISERHVTGAVTLDNRGTRYMGPVQAGLTVDVNDVLGLFERTELRGVSAAEFHEMRFAEIIHEEQIDSDGTKLALSGGYTHTHPDYKLKPFDINGRDKIYSVDVSHPFIRSRQSNLFGDIRFDVRQTDVESLGAGLYDDKLRVLRVGGTYDMVDRWAAINRFETTLSKGFSWDTGSSVGARSRTNAQSDFIKGTALVSRLQPIAGPVSLYLSASGQASANTLMTAEQFGLGGSSFGSAYDPSELVGDSAVAGRAELQYNRSGDFIYVPNYQFYGFYDGGVVWNRDAFAGTESQESLTSAGFGVRFNVMEPVSGGLEFALPLTHKVAANGQDGYGPRVFFSLAYRY